MTNYKLQEILTFVNADVNRAKKIVQAAGIEPR